MPNSMKLLAIPLLLVAGPALAATDSAFVLDAMKGDNSEVSLGQLAQQKGGSAKVRDFGKMLVDDHSAHKAKLVALAGMMKLGGTDALTPEAIRTGAQLKTQKGAAFDKTFKDYMVKDHKEDIAKYEAQAKSTKNADLRTLANDTLPALRKHLATAQAL